MNPSPRLSLSLFAFAALASGGTANAQDFFRDFGTSRSSGGIGPVVPSEYTYTDATPSGLRPVTRPQESEERDKYNFALGPMRFGVAAGFGRSLDPGGDFWISAGPVLTPRPHVAFSAASRQAVDAFYEAAIAAGGISNGGPGLRPVYHADYYAAFVLDPDGYNIEAVCHSVL